MEHYLPSYYDEMRKIANERWVKVESYRSKGDKGELVLRIRDKKYWFPMSPKTFEAFERKVKGSQKDALTMARKYIRQAPEPPYKGEWKGRRSKYYRKNRPKGFGKKRWDVSKAERIFEDE